MPLTASYIQRMVGGAIDASNAAPTPSHAPSGLPGLMCHVCGRQFGSASLEIHLKACRRKHELERGAPPVELAMRVPTNSTDGGWHQEYNEAAESAFAASLSPCPHCGRTFLPDRLTVHLRGCDAAKLASPHRFRRSSFDVGANAPAADTTTRAASRSSAVGAAAKSGPSGPSLPSCRFCGRQFGTASLHIHERACAEREGKSRSLPAQGSAHRATLSSSSAAGFLQSETVEASFAASLTPCPHCARTFLPDRLAVHLKACAPPKPLPKSSQVRSSSGLSSASRDRQSGVRDAVRLSHGHAPSVGAPAASPVPASSAAVSPAAASLVRAPALSSGGAPAASPVGAPAASPVGTPAASSVGKGEASSSGSSGSAPAAPSPPAAEPASGAAASPETQSHPLARAVASLMRIGSQVSNRPEQHPPDAPESAPACAASAAKDASDDDAEPQPRVLQLDVAPPANDGAPAAQERQQAADEPVDAEEEEALAKERLAVLRRSFARAQAMGTSLPRPSSPAFKAVDALQQQDRWGHSALAPSAAAPMGPAGSHAHAQTGPHAKHHGHPPSNAHASAPAHSHGPPVAAAPSGSRISWSPAQRGAASRKSSVCANAPDAAPPRRELRRSTSEAESSLRTAAGCGSRLVRGRTARERMLEVRDLLEAGLISQEEWEAKRLAILAEV